MARSKESFVPMRSRHLVEIRRKDPNQNVAYHAQMGEAVAMIWTPLLKKAIQRAQFQMTGKSKSVS
jgi:hypothetical protein